MLSSLRSPRSQNNKRLPTAVRNSVVALLAFKAVLSVIVEKEMKVVEKRNERDARRRNSEQRMHTVTLFGPFYFVIE